MQALGQRRSERGHAQSDILERPEVVADEDNDDDEGADKGSDDDDDFVMKKLMGIFASYSQPPTPASRPPRAPQPRHARTSKASKQARSHSTHSQPPLTPRARSEWPASLIWGLAERSSSKTPASKQEDER